MTPEAVVARLGEIIASHAEPNEDDIYAAMTDSGIPAPLADRAYKFTQIAWGRVVLDGLGIQFSPEYFCLDGAGNVIESGLLTQQPYFVAAMGLAQRYAWSPAFPKFAVMSADVNAVNNALHAGSKPENLVTGAAVLFMEPTTPAGIEKARQFLSQRLTAANRTGDAGGRRADRVKKSWWRFW